VVVLVVAVALSTGWWLVRDAGQTAAESPVTLVPGTRIDPSVPDPIYPPATPEAVAAEVERLSRFVEQQRGLAFQAPVAVTVLSTEDFRARVLADFDAEGTADLELTARLLAALDLLEPGDDVVAGTRNLLSTAALGFYDTVTDELVVEGDALTPLLQSTLVHELVHALDDQWFDLDRPEYADSDDEVAFGFSAVIEGNASRVEQAWVRQLDLDQRRELVRLQAARSQQVELGGVPWVLVELIQAPYVFGQALVEVLVAAGGEELVDQTFDRPPRTSSEVLWPERYLAGFTAVAVATPPADGEVFDQGMFGEFSLRLVIGAAAGDPKASAAARGWRGDAYVAWRNAEGNDCVRVDTEVVDLAARERLAEVVDLWVATLPDGSWEPLGTTGVRFTSCTVPPPADDGGSRA
jgi:hypothetical protein